MIAGFDPGTKSAVAIIDLDGNVIFLESFKGGIKEAIEKIRKIAKPVIVASDKSRLKAVEKLAAAFGAKTFFPQKDLSVEEKVELTKGYALRDQHERDALAAALYAYKRYRKLIERVKKKEVEIFEMVLKDRAPNIAEAMKEGKREERVVKKRSIDLASRVKALERKINMLNALLDKKEQELEEAMLEIERLQDERAVEVMKDKKVRKLEALVEKLKEEKKARIRLEKKLMEAHFRISKIEAELDKLRKAKPEEKEDIKAKILRMIKEYKERFR